MALPCSRSMLLLKAVPLKSSQSTFGPAQEFVSVARVKLAMAAWYDDKNWFTHSFLGVLGNSREE